MDYELITKFGIFLYSVISAFNPFLFFSFLVLPQFSISLTSIPHAFICNLSHATNLRKLTFNPWYPRCLFTLLSQLGSPFKIIEFMKVMGPSTGEKSKIFFKQRSQSLDNVWEKMVSFSSPLD